MEDWRHRIDLIDDILIETVARRMEISRQIGAYKARNGIAVLQPERFGRMMEVRQRRAAELGLDAGFVGRLFDLIHEESQRQQHTKQNEGRG